MMSFCLPLFSAEGLTRINRLLIFTSIFSESCSQHLSNWTQLLNRYHGSGKENFSVCQEFCITLAFIQNLRSCMLIPVCWKFLQTLLPKRILSYEVTLLECPPVSQLFSVQRRRKTSVSYFKTVDFRIT